MKTLTSTENKSVHTIKIDKRLKNAIELVDLGKIKISKNGKAKVGSQSNDKIYAVDFKQFTCTCIDYAIRHHKNPNHKCKHILASLIKSKSLEVTV